MSDSTVRKFIHRCPGCGKAYRISIRIKLHKVHRAICPKCERVNFFDNRTGRLDKESYQRPQVKPSTSVSVPTANAEITPLGQKSKPIRRMPKKSQRIWRGAGVLGVCAVLSGVVFSLLFVFSLEFPGLYLPARPGFYVARMRTVRPNRILDRNGKLLSELFSRKTGNLRFKDIPDSLKNKLVFVEDGHFYGHSGVHWPSVVRAMLRNVASMGYSQGASTITQQLARILLGSREKVLLRKLREAALARYLESNFGKEDILTAYMNHVYLGHGSVGMDTAARFYFDKGLKELGFVEELALVCLPSAPERYSPLKHPDRLGRKMDLVYERMAADGHPVISADKYAREKRKLLRGLNKSPAATVFGNRVERAPYVSEFVRERLAEILGEDYEFSAALTIETTIDGRLQDAAMNESRKYIQSIAKDYRPVRMEDGKVVRRDSLSKSIMDEYMVSALGPALFGHLPERLDNNRLQTASVGIEPRTGEVLFMQGGTEFRSGNQLNRALSMRRQTGSAVKPVVYSAAIESGVLTAASPMDDTPIYMPVQKRKPDDREYWLPGNISGVYEGAVSVRRAIVRSKNIPAIRAAQLLGMARLSNQFRKFYFPRRSEFDRRFRYDDTVAIGSLEMSPLEMAVAFGAFGNNGVIRRPFLIRRVLDEEGKVIYTGLDRDEFGLHVPLSRKALPGDTAEVIASIMEDAASYSAARAGLKGFPVLGKTGTTNEYRDTWFVGLVPGVSMALWVGYDNPAFSMYRGTGSSVAAPLWMRIVKKGANAKGDFEFSPNAVKAEVCKQSGKLPLPLGVVITGAFAASARSCKAV